MNCQIQRKSWVVAGLSSAILTIAMLAVGCADDATFTDGNNRSWGDYEYEGAPAIGGPEEVSFEDVGVGESVEESVEIRNEGSDILDVEVKRVDEPFSIDEDAADVGSFELAPDESVELTVAFTGGDEERVEGVLALETNDPDQTSFEVELSASVVVPCLDIEPADEVDFGEVELDQVAEAAVTVSNCAERSPTEVRLDRFEGSDAFGAVESVLESDVELQPAERLEIPIQFAPEETGSHTGVARFASDDVDEQEREVELVGEAMLRRCDTPDATVHHPAGDVAVDTDVRRGFFALPLEEEIRIEGIDLEDAEREWRLVEQPEESSATIDDPDGTEVGFEPDEYGDYAVELEVDRGEGFEECEPLRLEFETILDSALQVHLDWTTEAAPNPLEPPGVDLDLLLFNPDPENDVASRRCSDVNTNPAWSRDFDDEETWPEYLRDSRDGLRSEIIRLDKPREDGRYYVGVDVYDRHRSGLPGAHADLRVYLEGELAYFGEAFLEEPYSERSDWRVVEIVWEEERRINVIDELTSEGYPWGS